MDDSSAFWLNTLGATLTALVATIGGMVNSILVRRAQHQRDVEAAAKRIRLLYEHLGLTPPTIETMHDVFATLKYLKKNIKGVDGETIETKSVV